MASHTMNVANGATHGVAEGCGSIGELGDAGIYPNYIQQGRATTPGPADHGPYTMGEVP